MTTYRKLSDDQLRNVYVSFVESWTQFPDSDFYSVCLADVIRELKRRELEIPIS